MNVHRRIGNTLLGHDAPEWLTKKNNKQLNQFDQIMRVTKTKYQKVVAESKRFIEELKI